MDCRVTKRGKITNFGWLVILGVAALVVGVAIFAFTRHDDDHFEDTSSTSLATKSQSSGGKGPSALVPTYQDCDTLVIGAGVGGLTLGYRLAPILKGNLCIVDERDHIAGKVVSIRLLSSTSVRPVYFPTHAEQLRGGDTILRCLGQEVGMITTRRGAPGANQQLNYYGVNATSFLCYGKDEPTASAGCLAGDPAQAIIAPNSPFNQPSLYPNLPPNLCGNKDWTTCSYFDEMYTMVTSSSNANTIKVGESFYEYTDRILGSDGTRYFTNLYGDYFQGGSAAAAVDYLRYDNVYPYGHVSMMHGGPQIGLWSRVARLIQTNGSRIQLFTKINSVKRATGTDASAGFRYVSSANASSVIYRSKRVVLAFPPQHLQSMSGDIVADLRANKFVQNSDSVHACAFNAQFPTKWWLPHYSRCNTGYCAVAANFTLKPEARRFGSFQLIMHNDDPAESISFGQYIATEERQQGNVVRFFWEEEHCTYLDNILASGGQIAVQTEVIRRLRNWFAPAGVNVPTPVQGYYNSEPYAYALIGKNADFDTAAHMAFATAPLDGEDVVFSTEGFSNYDSGWQEGGARAAHRALSGRVFKNIISASSLDALTRCQASVTSGPNRYLDANNKNSGNDICLLMRGEYHMRDLANYSTCGGPSVYDYPTLSELTSNGFDMSATRWGSPATSEVFEVPSLVNRRRRGAAQ
jgi:hypothetical protein